jgi:hypothetical protein
MKHQYMRHIHGAKQVAEQYWTRKGKQKKETKKDKKKNEAGVLVCILKKGANECTDFSQFWVAKELAERS